MSFSRVCLNMKPRSGWAARSMATDCEILLLMYGCSAFLLMSWMTGFITKNVSSSDSPTSTCVGGTCCVPSAVRTNDSTMTMRVNDVSSTSIVGASVTTVSSSSTCSDSATSAGLVAGLTPMFTRGIGIVGLLGPGTPCANAGAAKSARANTEASAARTTRRRRFTLFAESLQQAEHRVALLPERLPLRLDVGIDRVAGDVGDVGHSGGSSAYQIVSVADLDDVNRRVLREHGRLDHGHEALAGGGHEPAAVERARGIRQPDEQQGDDRERPEDMENGVGRQRLNPVDDGVELADLHRELVVDDHDLTARDEDVVDVQVDRLGRELVELEHAARRHGHDLAQRELRLAEHRGDLQRHVVDEIEVRMAGGRGAHRGGLHRRERNGAAFLDAALGRRGARVQHGGRRRRGNGGVRCEPVLREDVEVEGERRREPVAQIERRGKRGERRRRKRGRVHGDGRLDVRRRVTRLGGDGLAHGAGDLRDRLGDDRELHRVQLAAVAGAAEHQLDDAAKVALAIARHEGDVRGRNAGHGGNGVRVDPDRRVARRARRRARRDGAPGQRSEHGGGGGEHAVGQYLQRVGHPYSSSSTIWLTRTASLSRLTPGNTLNFSRSFTVAASGSVTDLSNITRSPGCSAMRSRSDTTVLPSSTRTSTGARSTLRASMAMSCSVIPRPAVTLGDHWKSDSWVPTCWSTWYGRQKFMTPDMSPTLSSQVTNATIWSSGMMRGMNCGLESSASILSESVSR